MLVELHYLCNAKRGIIDHFHTSERGLAVAECDVSAVIFSTHRRPGDLLRPSLLIPQLKSEGLVALAHRSRSCRAWGPSSENPGSDDQSELPPALELLLEPDRWNERRLSKDDIRPGPAGGNRPS